MSVPYQARLVLPFGHEAYLSQLTTLRDQLKAALSGAVADANNEPIADAGKLAVQIKSLRAAHTIEASCRPNYGMLVRTHSLGTPFGGNLCYIANMPYPDDFVNKITCGDCIEVMREIPDESVDLVVTSPPYNLKNSTGNGMKDGRGGKWANAALMNGYSHHHDAMPHDEYVAWQRNCLAEMYRVIKNDGAIFYNHKWRVQNGLLQDRQDIVSGFPVRQIIIWKRKGGFNFNAGYFLPTYEVIYLIAKPDFKLASKANAHGDVWEFKQEMGNPHPAAFPVTLINRIISSTTAKLVLDPFIGSGTTAVAAQGLGRDFIGIELSPNYCEMANDRLAAVPKKDHRRLPLEQFSPLAA